MGADFGAEGGDETVRYVVDGEVAGRGQAKEGLKSPPPGQENRKTGEQEDRRTGGQDNRTGGRGFQGGFTPLSKWAAGGDLVTDETTGQITTMEA